jgi:hypothetical protein
MFQGVGGKGGKRGQWGLSKRTKKWQCCQVAKIPAKKFKRGLEKKELAGRIHGRILAEFYQKYQKRGQRKFSKEIPYFTVMTNIQ